MTVEEQAVECVAFVMGFEEDGMVKRDQHLINDLGADSIDLMELIIDLELSFNIKIPDEEAESFTTVESIIEYLNDRGIK